MSTPLRGLVADDERDPLDVGYVLKPYDGQRLAEAVDRVRTQARLEDPSAPGYLERVCIRSTGSVQIVRVADVEWIEACGNYVRLHTATERPLARETIKRLLAQLDPTKFCRIHRSAVVNLGRIREMKPAVSGDYLLRLDSGIRLRLSRSFRLEVDRRLRQL
jgi:two-component system LytT family response regulator